jgi:hypothetical protein
MKPLKQNVTLPPENEFRGAGSGEFTEKDWEDVVFRNATKFTVYRRLGLGKKDVREFGSFSEAAVDAYNDKTALVYAVTETGRWVCLVRPSWSHYLEIQKQMVEKAKVETRG